jgi:hypothetical protein
VIVESPLFGLVIYDNLGIKCYGINGQIIATVNTPSSVYEVSLVKEPFLHDIVTYVEEDKLIGLSTPDLRKICMTDIPQPIKYTSGLLMLKADGVLVYGPN